MLFDLTIEQSACGERSYCGRCPACTTALDIAVQVTTPATVTTPTRPCVQCLSPENIRCCEFGRDR